MAKTHTPDTVKAQMQADIAASNAKTGAADTTTHDAISRLIDGFGVQSGITPSGKITLTTNGTHNVTNYAEAEVAVPASGITPTGVKEITANGEHDVTNFAKANVSVPTGLNAKVLTATVSADKTSGNATMIANNAFLASLYNDPNAFIFMRYLGVAPSTAMLPFWFSANFPLFYNAGTAVKYDLIMRSTASATAFVAGGGLKATDNYNGHLKLDSSGNLKVYCNSTYPLRAGEYQIIAGTVEML